MKKVQFMQTPRIHVPAEKEKFTKIIHINDKQSVCIFKDKNYVFYFDPMGLPIPFDLEQELYTEDYYYNVVDFRQSKVMAQIFGDFMTDCSLPNTDKIELFYNFWTEKSNKDCFRKTVIQKFT